MALKNKSMYAILGILSIAPGTGYDIKKYSDTVLSGFWNENFGHIYPTLKTMLREGTVEILPGENEEKKICYRITERGREELAAWFEEDIVQQPMRSEFMLKFLFASGQPKEYVIQMLEKQKLLYQEEIRNYLEMERELDQGIEEISAERDLFIRAVLRKGILNGAASINWCNETILRMESSKPDCNS